MRLHLWKWQALQEEACSWGAATWRRLAADSLSPNHPLLGECSSAAEVRLAFSRACQARSNLHTGSFGMHLVMPRYHSLVFSPCGKMLAMIAQSPNKACFLASNGQDVQVEALRTVQLYSMDNPTLRAQVLNCDLPLVSCPCVEASEGCMCSQQDSRNWIAT